MASLQKRKRKKGTAWIIQFKLGGKRVNIYLGVKYGKRTAEDVKWIVEKCASSLSPDPQLDGAAVAWIQSAPNDIKKRLAAAGLISLKRRSTIKELVDEYLSEIKSGLKVSTFSAKLNRLNKFLRTLKADICKLCCDNESIYIDSSAFDFFIRSTEFLKRVIERSISTKLEKSNKEFLRDEIKRAREIAVAEGVSFSNSDEHVIKDLE